jgi:hypothetical protein
MIVEKQTKSGRRWKVIVSGKDPATGKRARRTPVFRTKREAEQAEAKLKTELNEGSYVARQNINFRDYSADWLPAMKAQVRASTWESYERNIRVHVLPRIGGMSLQALTPTHLNKMYAELLQDGRRPGKGNRRGKGGGLSPRTVSYVHTILHRALGDAARDGLVQRNVAALARPPKQGARGPRSCEPGARPNCGPSWDTSRATPAPGSTPSSISRPPPAFAGVKPSALPGETLTSMRDEPRSARRSCASATRSASRSPRPRRASARYRSIRPRSRCCGTSGQARRTVAWIAPISSSRRRASPSIPKPCPWYSSGGSSRAGCRGSDFTI